MPAAALGEMSAGVRIGQGDGLAGGGPGAASALYLIRDGRREALASKVTNLMLRKGDVIRLETSGGGGFGEPTMRIGEQVERDVQLGYVSPDGAVSSYGRRRADCRRIPGDLWRQD